MSEFIITYHLGGLIIGLAAFLIIGMFHPVVIRAHYCYGTNIWWIFLLLGIVGIVGSVLVENMIFSAILGVFGFASLWTIGELFDQKKRVEKGWFPENPKRKQKGDPR